MDVPDRFHQTASPHRILVADADEHARALYATTFALEHWDVTEALDGRDALVRALTRPPSLIVTELHLPFIDGVALVHILRTDRLTTHLPIAVVTGDVRLAEHERALNAGANVVLAKPTDASLLRIEIRRLIDHAIMLRERGTAAIAKAREEIEHADALLARRRSRLAKMQRDMTTAPPLPPPDLRCAECGAALTYEHSFLGGVSERQQEQWDYYRCARCGWFHYRHRTRKLRRAQ